MHRLIVSLSLLVAIAANARADLVKSEGFDASAATSLKVLEPVGAHLFVELPGGVKEDTVPSIISLPNRDAYVTVKVVAPDGQSWMGKVEIKALHQTVLRFSSGGGAQPARAAARFTGRLVNDSAAERCGGGGENVRFVVYAGGQAVAQTQLVFPGQEVTTALAAGSYYIQVLETAGRPMAQGTLRVARDGWKFQTGCVEAP